MKKAENIGDLREFAYADVGDFCWPTFFLGLGVLAVAIVSSAAALAGLIPYWAGCLINCWAICAGYTAGHEIAHGNMTGRHRHLAWLNTVFGAFLFSMPFHSFGMHRFIHMRHHRHTNDPKKDPDAWIDGANPIIVLFRLATHAPHYVYHTVRATRGMKGRRAFLARCAAEHIAPITIAVWLAASGYGREVLFLWVLPAMLAYPALAFLLDWLPHNLLGEGTAIENSRMIGAPKGWRGRALTWLMLYQNYHILHHLYPRAPFYKLRAIFEEGREALREEGAMARFL